MFFCNALFSVGQQTVGSGIADVLNVTTPLWTLMIGMTVGSERRPHTVRVGGLLLGFPGVLLIFAPWHESGVDGPGAAVGYAISFTSMGRTLAGKGHATITLSASQPIVATGLTALALPFGGPVPLSVEPVVLLGVVCTAFTSHLTYRPIAEEGATNAAAVGYLSPVVSVLLGAIVLAEPLSPRIAAGMAVVLLGVGLSRWRPKRSRHASTRLHETAREDPGEILPALCGLASNGSNRR